MARVRSDRSDGFGAARVEVRAAAALALSFAVFAVCAAAATAAPSSSSAAARASSFCSISRGVAGDIVHSTSLSNAKVTPAKLKVIYTKIQAAGPRLLRAAPKKVKTDLRPVLAFVNVVVTDFKKVNWSPALLVQRYGTALVPRAQTVAPHLNRLSTYFHKTCKLNV